MYIISFFPYFVRQIKLLLFLFCATNLWHFSFQTYSEKSWKKSDSTLHKKKSSNTLSSVKDKKILIIIIIDVPHLKCYNVTYCCDIREAPFETHELLSWVVGGDGAAVEVAAVVIDADDGIIIIPEWQTMLARQVTTLNSLSSDWLTSKYFHKYDVALIRNNQKL